MLIKIRRPSTFSNDNSPMHASFNGHYPPVYLLSILLAGCHAEATPEITTAMSQHARCFAAGHILCNANLRPDHP